MNKKSIHLDVVSAECSIFSGEIASLQVSCTEGELGVKPGHSPLLASIKPGMVKYRDLNNIDNVLYISGGMIEVQPNSISIMADTAVRIEDLDMQAAVDAKEKAEKAIANSSGDFNHTEAAQQLAQAVAQIQLLRSLKR
jgi:F-type H+-transporting ATPase subunit epsilon